jgi:antitoxin ParD1/3/4
MTSAQHQEVLIMNVSLTPELEKFVAAKVKSGSYNNASEVVRESLQLLKEYDDGLRASVERGWQQARAGLGVDGPTYMRKVRRRLLRAQREMDKTLR